MATPNLHTMPISPSMQDPAMTSPSKHKTRSITRHAQHDPTQQ